MILSIWSMFMKVGSRHQDLIFFVVLRIVLMVNKKNGDCSMWVLHEPKINCTCSKLTKERVHILMNSFPKQECFDFKSKKKNERSLWKNGSECVLSKCVYNENAICNNKKL